MRNKVVSDGELVAQAQEAFRAGQNAFEAALNPSTAPEFTLPLLHEGVECTCAALCALLSLRDRAQGVKPPKVGD